MADSVNSNAGGTRWPFHTPSNASSASGVAGRNSVVSAMSSYAGSLGHTYQHNNGSHSTNYASSRATAPPSLSRLSSMGHESRFQATRRLSEKPATQIDPMGMPGTGRLGRAAEHDTIPTGYKNTWVPAYKHPSMSRPPATPLNPAVIGSQHKPNDRFGANDNPNNQATAGYTDVPQSGTTTSLRYASTQGSSIADSRPSSNSGVSLTNIFGNIFRLNKNSSGNIPQYATNPNYQKKGSFMHGFGIGGGRFGALVNNTTPQEYNQKRNANKQLRAEQKAQAKAERAENTRNERALKQKRAKARSDRDKNY